MNESRCYITMRPLGRGAVLSPVIVEEVRRQKALVADMRALPPANSPANALLHRKCLVKHNPALRKCFAEIGLACD